METTIAYLERLIEEAKAHKEEMRKLGLNFMESIADSLIAQYEGLLEQLPEEESLQ
jgi:hypothetical protein